MKAYQLSYAEEQSAYITKVFSWMFAGLTVTGIFAYLFGNYAPFTTFLLSNKYMFFGTMIVELLLVFVLAGLVRHMSAFIATLVFLVYAALTGVTLSIVFLIYSHTQIGAAFGITALLFGIMAVYGYFTKTDLTTIGNLLLMALVGLIIASVVNLWLGNSLMDWVISAVSVLVFTGLTAYDTQKIKEYNIIGNHGTEEDHKEAIVAALTLYLDFINLFLNILKLLGNSDSDD